MAGHSHSANIKYRKDRVNAAKAKVFSKIARMITVASKLGGPEPDSNPRLRLAVEKARMVSMPKDNIERAIKRAVGGEDGTDYEEIRYEGYGPGGVAVIAEALTDNRNRTASEVRAAFSKHGGSLGETNSVSFMFDQVGAIYFDPEVGSAEEVFEAAVEVGASNVESGSDGHEVTCEPDDFNVVRDALAERFGDPREAHLVWKPKTYVEIDEDQAQTLFKLLDMLDDSDDVQRVAANFDIAEDIMTRLTA